MDPAIEMKIDVSRSASLGDSETIIISWDQVAPFNITVAGDVLDMLLVGPAPAGTHAGFNITIASINLTYVGPTILLLAPDASTVPYDYYSTISLFGYMLYSETDVCDWSSCPDINCTIGGLVAPVTSACMLY